MNKLALGIADTYALSSVAEVIGRGVPTVVVPAVDLVEEAFGLTTVDRNVPMRS